MVEMSRRIAIEAGRRYLGYNRLVDGLGIVGTSVLWRPWQS
jgi:hypothetical protein